MQPAKKAKRMAYSAPPDLAYEYVIKLITAVGPMLISLTVPKKMYSSGPISDEYSPYCNLDENFSINF